jgi:tRNA(Ile)-lysidine synthase TilS/MesJ
LTLDWPRNQRPAAALLETEARKVRYAQLAHACSDIGTRWLWLGHHADDAQETLLFRLSRASGVFGLAGLMPMAPWPFPYDQSLAKQQQYGLYLLRPLLSIPKVGYMPFVHY